MSGSAESLRREILEILRAQYDRSENSWLVSARVGDEKLYNALDYPNEQIDKIIANLEARGLIDTNVSLWNGEWIDAEITEQGIDYFESRINEGTYKPASPTGHQTIHIHGDVSGPVSQTSGGDTYNITNIFEAITYARVLLAENDSIDEDDKDEALEHLEIIEEEINSDYPDKEVISNSWDWLKKYGPSFVVSVLSGLLTGWVLG